MQSHKFSSFISEKFKVIGAFFSALARFTGEKRQRRKSEVTDETSSSMNRECEA
jgi:hypothetical protein